MISNFRHFFLLVLGLSSLAFIADASAQIRVDLALRRSSFIRYEPVVAIVTVTNMTGAPLELRDEGNHKWFSFNIQSATGALVPPYNPDYTLTPVSVGPGQSIKRGVNITPLYPITEYGIYRVRATVYDARTGRYYSSNPPLNIEISEGRVLWQQKVGVPEGSPLGGGVRSLTLLSERLPGSTQLYLRIEDKENGLVYCTHQLGRYVSLTKPDIEVGANNQIHILQNISPKVFLYTCSDLNGKILERKQFASTDTNRPSLQRDANGDFHVTGGIFLDPKAEEAAQAAQQKAGPPPTISSRPVPLPNSR